MLTIDEINESAQSFGEDNRLISTLLHPSDAGKDYITSNNAYRWYAALSLLHPAKVITEIGSRFGYSIGTMLAASYPMTERVYIIDNESYVKNSVSHFVKWAHENYPVVVVHYKSRPEFLEKADIVSVDGDHSYEGTLADLVWAWWHVKDDGYIIIDDIDHPAVPGVKLSTDYFIKMLGAPFVYIPSFRGTYVIGRSHAK